MNIRWRNLAFATVLAGTFMSVLNTNMIRVASPTVMQEFGVDVRSLTWLFNGYLLPYSVFMPVFGRLGDLYGRRRLYMSGMVVFTAASFLCSLAWSYWALVLCRTLQAIGAAALYPNAMVMATGLFGPEHRGRALGIYGSTASVGAVIGPAVGGFLVEYLRWRSVFYVNIPVGLAALTGAWLLLKESERREVADFDIQGSAYLAAAVFSLVMVITRVGTPGLGGTLTYLGVFAVTTVMFARTEARSASPVVDPSLLRNRVFMGGAVCGSIHMLTAQASMFLLPLFLAQIKGMAGAAIGLVMLPSACIRVFASPLGGALSDRLGSRVPVTIGLAVQVVTFALLARLTPAASPLYITAALLCNGVGAGLMWSPVLSAVMGSVPPERSGVVAGVFNMLRLIAGMGGSTVAGLLLARSIHLVDPSRLAPVPGYRDAYALLVVLCLLGQLSVRWLSDQGVGRITSATQ